MANGTTVLDIKKEVLQRVGEKDDGTSDLDARALSYINKCQQKIIAGASEFDLDLGEPWPWAKSPFRGVITILPAYGTDFGNGSINCTFNSKNGTFSAIPTMNGSNISLKGYWLNLQQANEWYQIITHVSGTLAFTLDTTYNDATVNLSPFIAAPLDYTLAATGQSATPPTELGGIQRLASPLEVYRNQTFDNDNEYKCYGVDIREMRRQYPLALIELGIPTRFAITTQVDGTINIRFNKYTDIQTRMDFDYLPVPQDVTATPDASPVIPREFRDVLVYGPAYWLALDKNDDRAQQYLLMTQSILKAMIADSRKKRDHVQKQKAVLVPRWDNVNQKKRILYT